MPKRTFEIEWSNPRGEDLPDDPMDCLWMNSGNLLICLTTYCPNTRFTARDVTGDGIATTEAFSEGPIGEARQHARMKEIIDG